MNYWILCVVVICVCIVVTSFFSVKAAKQHVLAANSAMEKLLDALGEGRL